MNEWPNGERKRRVSIRSSTPICYYRDVNQIYQFLWSSQTIRSFPYLMSLMNRSVRSVVLLWLLLSLAEGSTCSLFFNTALDSTWETPSMTSDSARSPRFLWQIKDWSSYESGHSFLFCPSESDGLIFSLMPDLISSFLFICIHSSNVQFTVFFWPIFARSKLSTHFFNTRETLRSKALRLFLCSTKQTITQLPQGRFRFCENKSPFFFSFLNNFYVNCIFDLSRLIGGIVLLGWSESTLCHYLWVK